MTPTSGWGLSIRLSLFELRETGDSDEDESSSESSPVLVRVFLWKPHDKLLGILRVLNPATRKDLADRTWGSSGTNQKQHLVQR